MTGRVLLVHYTPPGIVGGVEHIMHQHAHLLLQRGYQVELVAGRAADSDVPLHVIPQLDVAGRGSGVEAQLDGGVITPRFYEIRRAILDQMVPLTAEADIIIVHNVFTLHFSLPLTAVLWELAASRPPGSIIAWCHDLAWTNPLYIPLMHPGYPWELLRTPAPGVTYVTVSEERRDELRELWGRDDVPITTVPNGIDAEGFLRLSQPARAIVERHRLLERDLVLLLPVRITRRKNIEAGIAAVRSLKDRGLDVVFLISAPQAPHHPGRSDAYLNKLKALRAEMGVETEVIFLADELGHNLDIEVVGELYSVADALLFPSSQEGFGLPILEAGLARVPVVLSDIQIFREVGEDDVWRFGLNSPADTIARTILDALDNRPSHLYRRVLATYRWDSIVDRHIIPLLHPAQSGDVRDAAAVS